MHASAPYFSPTNGADLEAQPLAWLLSHIERNETGALVTICGVDGGAPRPVGTQMAVLADGRFDGQISGGCVESAVAAEVAQVIADGRDTILKFGRGAKAIDISFPCGGGVEVLVHVRPAPEVLRQALYNISARQPFGLAIDWKAQTSRIIEECASTGWTNTRFVRRFEPKTRVLLVGRGQELEVTARTASGAGYEVLAATPSSNTASVLAELAISNVRLLSPHSDFDLPIDPWTATVLLFHEHDWEGAILEKALAANGFYIGALGSPKTHRQRCESLRLRGVSPAELERIKGPIGSIERARDPSTLAISILAEIAQERILLSSRH